MSERRALFGSLAVLVATVACERPGDTVVVSPGAQDMPPAQTSDGHVVGADDKSPAHTLAEQGTTAHPAPGWKVGPDGVSYDPKREPAGASDPGSTTIQQPGGAQEAVPKGDSKP